MRAFDGPDLEKAPPHPPPWHRLHDLARPDAEAHPQPLLLPPDLHEPRPGRGGLRPALGGLRRPADVSGRPGAPAERPAALALHLRRRRLPRRERATRLQARPRPAGGRAQARRRRRLNPEEWAPPSPKRQRGGLAGAWGWGLLPPPVPAGGTV